MKTNKELNDPDVATNSLASPQTSPEKQAQCGFSCSFSHSSQLLSSHRKLMNNGLRCAGVPPGTVSHHNTGSNTPSGCPCCFFSTFGHIYFHCVWCCTALFIYEGHLILLSDWVKSKQASFQSLLFLFISQCPQQQSDCATFWGMMRKPCLHPLSSPRWTRCNTRATSWSGENQLGRKTYKHSTYWKLKICIL